MIDAILHPEDPSRLVAVEDLLGDLHRGNLSALALIQSQDDRLDALQATVAALAIRVETLEALSFEVAALTRTVDDLNTRHELHVEGVTERIDALTDRVAALEPKPEPAFTFGFDMSGNQSVAQVEAALAEPQNDYGIIKVTEGEGFVNTRLDAQAKALIASGKRRGWYHYCWQNQDGVKEAQHFWRNVEPYIQPGDCWFADVENWDSLNGYAAMQGVTWDQRFDYYQAFRAEMVRLSGMVGNIYPTWDVIKGFREQCGMLNADRTVKTTPTPEWAEFTEAGLWVPQYFITVNGVRRAAKPGEYDTVSGGWDVFIHQYTSSPYDKNWMPGGDKLWARHAVA